MTAKGKIGVTGEMAKRFNICETNVQREAWDSGPISKHNSSPIDETKPELHGQGLKAVVWSSERLRGVFKPMSCRYRLTTCYMTTHLQRRLSAMMLRSDPRKTTTSSSLPITPGNTTKDAMESLLRRL